MPSHARPLADIRTIDQLLKAFFTFLDGEVAAGKNKAATVAYYRAQLDPWRASLNRCAACQGKGTIGKKKKCGKCRGTGEVFWDAAIEDLRAFHLMGAGGVKRPRIQAVQRLFNWARAQDLVEGSPFDNVKLPPLGKRKRTLDSLELAVLLRAASRPLRWLLLFALHTICRPGEIRGVLWLHYNAAKQQFVLEEFKADKRRSDQSELRVIPVDAFLTRILAIWRSRRSPAAEDPLFENSKGRAWTKDALVQAVDTARRRAWIVSVRSADPDEGEEQLVGVVARDEAQAREKAISAGFEPLSARSLHQGRESVVAYHLRHTRATRAIENGANIVHLSKAMGHSTTRMTERYLHLDAGALGHVVDLAAGKGK